MDRVQDKINQLPLTPGVYIMKSGEGKILYIGKATSLRKRVRSHFVRGKSVKADIFIEKVRNIDYIECDSQAQALILEAALIKEKKPKYNVTLKDDKSYPYVEITKDKFPRVFISRPKVKRDSILLGPYSEAKILRASLNMIRKVFPYCSCRGRFKKPCLFYHIGLCPGPCAGKISSRKYRENIRGIRKILGGERKKLIDDLDRKMKKAAGQKKFEEAASLRDKLAVLESLYKAKAQTNQLLALKENLKLDSVPLVIEAIDISSLSGQQATGAVVVFRNGEADKNSYRRYRIKEVEKIDDYAMIGEVVRRRYSRFVQNHKDLPDLVIIDGGKGHVKRAKEEMDSLAVTVPVIGIAKRNEEIWFPQSESPLVIPKDNPCLHLIQRIRDEAHRFAQSYHKLLRKKKLVERSKA